VIVKVSKLLPLSEEMHDGRQSFDVLWSAIMSYKTPERHKSDSINN